MDHYEIIKNTSTRRMDVPYHPFFLKSSIFCIFFRLDIHFDNIRFIPYGPYPHGGVFHASPPEGMAPL
jgi:hypothetical protein